MNTTKIYIIERNNKLISVMVDKDLAQFYGVETRHLNQWSKTNKDKFEGERFQLTREESIKIIGYDDEQNQSVTYKRTVYTEIGALTFSGILKSKKAHEVFKVLLNSFFAFRKIMEQSNLNYDKKELLELKGRVDKIEDQLKFNQAPLYIGSNSGPILINQGKMTFNNLPDIFHIHCQGY